MDKLNAVPLGLRQRAEKPMRDHGTAGGLIVRERLPQPLGLDGGVEFLGCVGNDPLGRGQTLGQDARLKNHALFLGGDPQRWILRRRCGKINHSPQHLGQMPADLPKRPLAHGFMALQKAVDIGHHFVKARELKHSALG